MLQQPLLAVHEDAVDTEAFLAYEEGCEKDIIATNMAPLVNSWKVIDSMENTFIPSIEGLRGLAISLTIVCHTLNDHPHLRDGTGRMGVTIFFVLSGFLITAVLIRQESKATELYQHIPRFYMDRFARLCPALLLMVTLLSSLYLLAGRASVDMARSAFYALFYLSNLKGAWGPWGNTWSLACEEQFYILWSLLLPLVRRCRHTRIRSSIILGTIAASAIMCHVAVLNPSSRWAQNWDTQLVANMYKMLLGASLRLVPLPPFLMTKTTARVGLLGLTLILLVSILMDRINFQDNQANFLNILNYLSAIFTAFILSGLSGSKGGLDVLQLPMIRFAGRISYSWYLWQYPLINFDDWTPGIYHRLGVSFVALIIAVISTLYLEEPLLKRYKESKSRKITTSSNDKHLPS